MNEKEREARRKRQRELRRRQVQRRLIMLVCAASAALVVLIIILIVTDPDKAENSTLTNGSQGEAANQENETSMNAGNSYWATDENGEVSLMSGGESASGAGQYDRTGQMGENGQTAGIAGEDQGASAAQTDQAASGDQAAQSAQTSQTGLFDPEACNVTPEELPAKVDETAAKLAECYTGELLPATTAEYTDRSADFAVQPGVPCGADPVEGEKVVYLTLDDGPSANTITALNILDHYGIKATFFVTGLNPDYFYLIKEAYDRGHTIGLHTYSHDYEFVYSSAENYYSDLNQIGQVVSEQIGYVPCFIRFPGGAANYISHDYCEGIMTFLTQDVGQYGYQYFDWNASSGDGSEEPNAAQLADAAKSYDYYDTIVMLSHDGSTKEKTMHALPFIIEYYLSKGYEFRPLTRNSYTAHHSVEN